jgi:hypothetical protein
MTYHSLDQIFDEIDGTRARLVARYESLTETERGFRPDANAWSADQIVDHLATIEGNMLRLINKLLGKAEAAGIPAPADGTITPISMDEFNRVANANKFEAPEPVRPSGTRTGQESIAAMQASRAEVHGLRPRLAAVDLTEVTFPHPFAGPLNLYQWLVFIGLHEQRHINQIERTIPKQDGITS